MTATINLTSNAKGNDVSNALDLKNRDDTVLSNPGTQVITMVISDPMTKAILYEYVDSPQLILDTASTWDLLLDRVTDLANIVAGKTYNHEIWSTSAGDDRILQISGTFILNDFVGPS